MSKVVFILGAGASKECGAPLMANFLDIAYNLHATNGSGDKAEDFENVFKAIGALQQVHSKSQLDLTNIESIFTALEIANVLGKLPSFEADEIPNVIKSLKEVIVKTLEQTIDFPTRSSHIDAPAAYVNFVKLIQYLRADAHPQQSVSVITFNYDIALDMAFFRGGIGPDYGIPPDPGARNPVQLLKLHGSLNWAVRKDSDSVYPLQLNKFFEKYNIQGFDTHGTCKVEIGSKLQEYFTTFTDVEVQKEPVIVPPTWNKADYHQSLSKIWATAADHLSEAEQIFIIGYSLPETDAFFRLLYGLGTVGNNPLKRIVVYNPDDSGQVEQRFRDMLGPGAVARFEYVPFIFSGSISPIKSYFPNK